MGHRSRSRAATEPAAAFPEGARVAFFGGVYNNHLALRAALEDAVRAGAGAVYCLGDLGGFGPSPAKVVPILREAGIPSLRGNYDDSVGFGKGDCACGYTDPRDNRFAQISFDYTAVRTPEAHKAWMRGLPEQMRIAAGGRRVLLCHGSPRRVNEFLWESASSTAFLDWMAAAHEADVVLCTHTGIHWHRPLPGGPHFINVGAIGRPANDGRTDVWYALVDFGAELRVEFRPVAYDHDALAAEMRAEGLPQEFVETVLTGWWTCCLENLPARERLRGRH
jgi:diadenosine tetraphosphatase ApaH/serine/threonine PP2A family protein phosphatase